MNLKEYIEERKAISKIYCGYFAYNPYTKRITKNCRYKLEELLEEVTNDLKHRRGFTEYNVVWKKRLETALWEEYYPK